MYIQFGECFCKGIQLNENDFILIDSGGNGPHLFVLQKMTDHKGTVAEIGFPETAEMVAGIHNLIRDGLKYREIRRLLK